MKKKKKRKKPNKDIEKLAKRIKALRINEGYVNQEHFAFNHYFARTQYARYERGEDLRFTSLIKLVRAFGISLEEFFSKGFGEETRTGRY
jgi:transcriptional regulator with XRE-family HTH domain